MSTLKTSLVCLCLFLAVQLSPYLVLSQVNSGMAHCTGLQHGAPKTDSEIRANRLALRLQRTCASTARFYFWLPSGKTL
jgi:hypothetical protein